MIKSQDFFDPEVSFQTDLAFFLFPPPGGVGFGLPGVCFGLLGVAFRVFSVLSGSQKLWSENVFFHFCPPNQGKTMHPGGGPKSSKKLGGPDPGLEETCCLFVGPYEKPSHQVWVSWGEGTPKPTPGRPKPVPFSPLKTP